MPIDTVYRLDTRPPSLILASGFAGTRGHDANRLYGPNTVYTSESVLGLISFALECLHGRSGERVELPLDAAPPMPWVSRSAIMYAYRIDIRGLEHVAAARSLGFSYPRLNANMHFTNAENIRNLNGASPVVAAFRGQAAPLADAALEYDVLEQAAMYGLDCARYTQEVIVRGPIGPERVTLYQILPATAIGRRVTRTRTTTP